MYSKEVIVTIPDEKYARNHNGEHISYAIDERLKLKTDEKIKKSLEKKDKDFLAIIDGEEGSGKCQPAGSKVLMSNGEFKDIESIKIGEEVISPFNDNQFSKVTEVSTHFSQDNYIFKDYYGKTLFECSANHLIPLKFNVFDSNKRKCSEKIENFMAKDLFTKSNKWFRKNHAVLMIGTKIDEFKGEKICQHCSKTIDPEVNAYSLGVYLGNGSFSSTNAGSGGQIAITNSNEDIMNEVMKYYLPSKIYTKPKNTAKMYRFSLYSKLGQYLLHSGLKSKGSATKFIPKDALHSSFKFRIDLLSGMIDTDGFVSKKSQKSITTKSLQLANDIDFLVKSLGGFSYIQKVTKKCCNNGKIGNYFMITFNLGFLNKSLNLKNKFKVNRLRNFNGKENGINFKIEKSFPKQVYGITLDSESQLYITDNFCVTHNSTFGIQWAKYVDPTLDLSRICFSAEEFREAILKAKKGQAVVYDEAFTGLSSRSSLGQVNRTLVSLGMQIRQKNLFIVLILPLVFLLDKYFVMGRAKVLVHVYENKGRRGYFRVYNKKKIKLLILFGKNTFSYSKKVRTNFKGHFFGKFALGDENEIEYRKKKMKALMDTESNPLTSQQVKYMEQRNLLLHILKKELKESDGKPISFRKMENYLSDYGLDLSYVQIRQICSKYGDKEEEKVLIDKEISQLDKNNNKKDIKDDGFKALECEKGNDLEEFDEDNAVNEDENDDFKALSEESNDSDDF